MDSITRNNVFSVEPLIRLIEEVIEEEESLKILQTNLLPTDFLLYHIGTVLQDQQAPEVLKVWLQLLHNCVTHAKNMLHRSNSRQRFLDCLSNKPGRPSKQIRNWRLHFNYLFQGLESEYSVFVRGGGNPLIRLIEEVIEEEESLEILQTNLLPMDFLLHHISIVLQDQQAPEVLKVWLQLLHNCDRQAKNMLHRSNSRQRFLDCLSNKPGRPSKQIRNWRLYFNYLFQGLESEYSVFLRGREAVIGPVIAPIIPLMKDVIEEEEERHTLQTDLVPLDNLLLDISVVFQDQHQAAPAALKAWLQLLQNWLPKAKSILHGYAPSQRQRRRLDSLIGNGERSPQEVNKWKVLFNFLFQGLQEDFSMFVTSTSHCIIKGDPISIEGQRLSKDEAEATDEGQRLTTSHQFINEDPIQLELESTEESIEGQPLSTDETEVPINEVQESVQPPTTNKAEISTDKAEESTYEVCISKDEPESSTDEAEISTGKTEESTYEIYIAKDEPESSTDKAEESARPLSIEDLISIEGHPLSTDEAEVPINEVQESEQPHTRDEAEESTLSKDEAWMLFRKFAFKENRVPTDIEEFATNIADECKGFRLATILVAAAMTGKTRVEEWETSLSSIKNAIFSSPDTLHPELYKALRWSYDALPNSEVKNCFLYCAMYAKDEDINVQELVQMWIAEGFVSSKQENHLMDMAIGRSYVNLLLDRCFFLHHTYESAIIRDLFVPEEQCIRVHHAVREMAIYIGEQEENCLFKAGQGLQNFPTIDNENCKRISVLENDIENLPAEFPCPKLVSLMLSTDNSIEEVPPGFLVSLTSLRVLSLQGSRINSIPSSLGQLKQLELFSLQGLNIRDLPEEICHLSSLQFLDLRYCRRLQSLPSKIGDLKNLKYLGLGDCDDLEVIPHEIWQLTSLSTLDATEVELSVEAESEARSIWRLKGLRNLTMLRITVKVTSSGIIEEGIMGTWLNMRHLVLDFGNDDDDDVMVDLPQDMKNMKRLQLFVMVGCRRSSLPEYICNFQHLESIALEGCHQLQRLSPLERVPNLKALWLWHCDGLKGLGMGKSGGFLMLEKLKVANLENLESIGRVSDSDVWNESTLPRLRILVVVHCPMLERLPVGMDKLPNLTAIFGEEDWWQQIIWEADGDMKTRLQSLYKKM